MSFIIAIYRRRPATLHPMGLGQYFCNAHEIPDPVLYDMTELNECLEYINNKGYDSLSHSALLSYNQTNEFKEQA